MVPPCSGRITRVPPYSLSTLEITFRLRGYHPLWPDFPDSSAKFARLMSTGLLRVRSPLLAESRLISFPPGTEMFQFPGFASHAYVFSMRYRRSGGFPHSDIPGSKLVCQLPETFRRLPRPSSPPTAKASTTYAYSLDHITPIVLGDMVAGLSHECDTLYSIIKLNQLDPRRHTQFRLLKSRCGLLRRM